MVYIYSGIHPVTGTAGVDTATSGIDKVSSGVVVDVVVVSGGVVIVAVLPGPGALTLDVVPMAGPQVLPAEGTDISSARCLPCTEGYQR